MSIKKTTEYMENLARITLIHLLGFDEADLFCDDKPDIQSHSGHVGIEVRQDVFENEQIIFRAAERVWGMQRKYAPKKEIQRIEKSGGVITVDSSGCINGITAPGTNNCSKHIIESAKDKLIKLNAGGYKIFQENHLYLFVESLMLECCESYIYELMEFVHSYQGSRSLSFSKIYLDQHYVLYVCDIQNMKLQKINISKAERDYRAAEVALICPD